MSKTDDVINLVNKDAVVARNRTQELTSLVDSLRKHTDIIVESISSISVASEEISASGNEINERAEGQQSSMDIMAKAVLELLNAIETLNKLVGEFRLEE